MLVKLLPRGFALNSRNVKGKNILKFMANFLQVLGGDVSAVFSPQDALFLNDVHALQHSELYLTLREETVYI